MDQSLHFFSAFMMGLFGSMHCVGMCGGISAALSFAIDGGSRLKRVSILLAYNLGRILTYGLMGLFVGWIIASAFQVSMQEPVHASHVGHALHGGSQANSLSNYTNTFFQNLNIARLLAGLLMISMGLYLAGWWLGLARLEKLGGFFWRYIQPLGKKIFPVTSVSKALLLGVVWGWLPCGLVYTSLVFSATQASPVNSSLTMLVFGVGTLPTLMVSGFFAEELKRLLQQKGLRQLVGVLIIMFGLWTAANALGLHIGH